MTDFLILNKIRINLMLLKNYYEKLLENLKCHDIEISIWSPIVSGNYPQNYLNPR